MHKLDAILIPELRRIRDGVRELDKNTDEAAGILLEQDAGNVP